MEGGVQDSLGVDTPENKAALPGAPHTPPPLGKIKARVEVHDLDDASFRALYTEISPEEAVIAAYAQSQDDYNTWEYQKKHLWRVRWHANSVSCGTFCALK